MNDYKCVCCNNDLSVGLVLFTKSELYPNNIRYLHCSECGKTYLFDFNTGIIKEVDYSVKNIEKDIINGLNKLNESFTDLEIKNNEKEKNDCDNCNKNCHHNRLH